MLKVPIYTQPDDETCGQTCLHAIYNYYGLDITLDKIIAEVQRAYSGGTLAPHLAIHALKNKFHTTIYINNLDIFDPSWFEKQEGDSKLIINKLEEQMKYKWDRNLHQASQAYIEYLQYGGKIKFHTLTPHLLKSYFKRNLPILTGLSATYLYKCQRELYLGNTSTFNDVKGTPCGHFVVLSGYDKKNKRIVVADPHAHSIVKGNYYKVSSHHLINAIMLGVLTYDANLLIIETEQSYNENWNSSK